MFDGVSDTVDHEVGRLTDDLGTRSRMYWRLQTALETASDAIDDASPGNIRALRSLARTLVERRARDLDEIVETLSISR